jgi:hypothetical protein
MRPASFSALVSALSLVVAVCAGGCSSGDAAETGAVSETPAAVVTTDTGGYSISVHSAPDAMPSRGVNTLRLDVTHTADGSPAIGLDLDVTPWMPAHGHGSSVKPTVTPGATPGTYTVSNVNLYMPGLWEIRTTIGGSATDHVAPKFDIR